MLFQNREGIGVEVASMPRKRRRVCDTRPRALVDWRNLALLFLAEHSGLTSAQIATIPGLNLSERAIRQGIVNAMRSLRSRHANTPQSKESTTKRVAEAARRSPPKLSPSHRKELGQTAEGREWLKMIGQLPEDR